MYVPSVIREKWCGLGSGAADKQYGLSYDWCRPSVEAKQQQQQQQRQQQQWGSKGAPSWSAVAFFHAQNFVEIQVLADGSPFSVFPFPAPGWSQAGYIWRPVKCSPVVHDSINEATMWLNMLLPFCFVPHSQKKSSRSNIVHQTVCRSQYRSCH